MPKLDRWIVASRMVEVLDQDTIRRILDLGGQIGGGWCQLHQHIFVTKDNKEAIEEVLLGRGYTVEGAETFEHSIEFHDHRTAAGTPGTVPASKGA